MKGQAFNFKTEMNMYMNMRMYLMLFSQADNMAGCMARLSYIQS